MALGTEAPSVWNAATLGQLWGKRECQASEDTQWPGRRGPKRPEKAGALLEDLGPDKGACRLPQACPLSPRGCQVPEKLAQDMASLSSL